MSLGNIGFIYLVPMLLAPLLGIWTGLLQYRGQKSQASTSASAQLTGDLRTEVARQKEAIINLERKVITMRDVLLRMVETIDDTPHETKSQLMTLIREGLKEAQ